MAGVQERMVTVMWHAHSILTDTLFPAGGSCLIEEQKQKIRVPHKSCRLSQTTALSSGTELELKQITTIKTCDENN